MIHRIKINYPPQDLFKIHVIPSPLLKYLCLFFTHWEKAYNIGLWFHKCEKSVVTRDIFLFHKFVFIKNRLYFVVHLPPPHINCLCTFGVIRWETMSIPKTSSSQSTQKKAQLLNNVLTWNYNLTLVSQMESNKKNLGTQYTNQI